MADSAGSNRFSSVSGHEFRESLESDYEELDRAIAASSWKTVYVLAGSIIETILIDYLSTVERSIVGSDPLTLDLGKAIDTCQRLRVLSDKTAHLCHAVRHYRNLIHPGRTVRLNERPDEAGAKVARALVDVVLADVEAKRKAVYGLTAEQIVGKLGRDSTAVSILSHLLKDTSPHERQRLLLDIVPNRYCELRDDPFSDEEQEASALQTCFRAALDMADDDAKRRVVARFAQVLREGTGDVVFTHEKAFFRGGDLAYATESDGALIRQHALSRANKEGFDSVREVLDGMEGHLKGDDIRLAVDCVVRSVIRDQSSAAARRAQSFLSAAFSYADKAGKAAISTRLEEWTAQLRNSHKNDAVQAVSELKNYVEDDVPF